MFTRRKRSSIMAAIPSRGNIATELRFMRLMRRSGIRGWRRGSRLPGRPDFCFGREKLAVFIDGDFWHGNPRKFRIPKSNVRYWRNKILGNRKRDQEVAALLESAGWRVVRYWQSSLRDGEAVMARLKTTLLKCGRHSAERPRLITNGKR